jgi:hypothetical protein
LEGYQWRKIVKVTPRRRRSGRRRWGCPDTPLATTGHPQAVRWVPPPPPLAPTAGEGVPAAMSPIPPLCSTSASDAPAPRRRRSARQYSEVRGSHVGGPAVCVISLSWLTPPALLQPRSPYRGGDGVEILSANTRERCRWVPRGYSLTPRATGAVLAMIWPVPPLCLTSASDARATRRRPETALGISPRRDPLPPPASVEGLLCI